MRPGRLDQFIYLPMSYYDSRLSITRTTLIKSLISRDVDLSYLVAQTDKFTGADLTEIIKVLVKLRYVTKLKGIWKGKGLRKRMRMVTILWKVMMMLKMIPCPKFFLDILNQQLGMPENPCLIEIRLSMLILRILCSRVERQLLDPEGEVWYHFPSSFRLTVVIVR